MARKILWSVFFALLLVAVSLAILLVAGVEFGARPDDGGQKQEAVASELPAPEVESGLRGELGIDRNINESTLDDYLGRDDVVYRDVRMLVDPANYEAIEGDSYLSGYVEGFEVVPYPYLCEVSGLPEAVGEPYSGPTLFSVADDGSYVANYEESMAILKDLFPRDKTIFLMCGGGGYAGMTKKLLVGLGWDGSRIYDVGGYWYYKGEHAVEVRHGEKGDYRYDFHMVPYHVIDFSVLHPMDGYKPQEYAGEQKLDDSVGEDEILGDGMTRLSDASEIDALVDAKSDFVLYAYLPGCVSCASFTPVIDEFADTRQVGVYQISYEAVRGAKEGAAGEVANLVKYTPTVIVYRGGKIQDMLSPTSDDDLDYYKTLESFSGWVAQHLGTEVVTSETINETVGCESGCEA